MRGNLAKVPLVAVLYAAIVRFIGLFIPFSQAYGAAAVEFDISLGPLDHIWFLGFCLFVGVICAICFAGIDKSGRGALLTLTPIFLGFLVVMPVFESLLLGEVTGLMDSSDLLMRMAQLGGGTIITLILCLLLFVRPDASPEGGAAAPPKAKKVKGAPGKFKIIKLLLYLLLALPGSFFILYFVLGYILAWTNETIRTFYAGQGTEDGGFFFMFVTMLISHNYYAVITLLRGLLLGILSFLLMLRLEGKRRLFLALNIMFFLAGVFLFLIPTPTMSWEVQIIHFVSSGVVMIIYAVIAAILLPLTYNKNLPPPESAADPAAKPAVSTGKPIPKRR